jgi:hypothetical protein
MGYANLYGKGVASAQAGANRAYDVEQNNLNLKNIGGTISSVIGLKQSQSAYENLAGDNGVLSKQIENYRGLLTDGKLDDYQKADIEAKLSSLELLKGGLNVGNIGTFTDMYRRFLAPVDQLALSKAALGVEAMMPYRMGMLGLQNAMLNMKTPLMNAQADKAAAEAEKIQGQNKLIKQITGANNPENITMQNGSSGMAGAIFGF